MNLQQPHQDKAASQPEPEEEGWQPKLSLLGREFILPRARWLRIAIAAVLIFGGVLGFLPILGFWMLPLGLLILSYEFAWVRRHRRRATVWWGRRRSPRP